MQRSNTLLKQSLRCFFNIGKFIWGLPTTKTGCKLPKFRRDTLICWVAKSPKSAILAAISRRKPKNIGHDRMIWYDYAKSSFTQKLHIKIYQIWMSIPCHKKRCVQEWDPEIAMWKHHDTPLEWGGPPFVPDLKNQNTWFDPPSHFQSWPLPSVGLFWWHPLCWESSRGPLTQPSIAQHCQGYALPVMVRNLDRFRGQNVGQDGQNVGPRLWLPGKSHQQMVTFYTTRHVEKMGSFWENLRQYWTCH